MGISSTLGFSQDTLDVLGRRASRHRLPKSRHGSIENIAVGFVALSVCKIQLSTRARLFGATLCQSSALAILRAFPMLTPS